MYDRIEEKDELQKQKEWTKKPSCLFRVKLYNRREKEEPPHKRNPNPT